MRPSKENTFTHRLEWWTGDERSVWKPLVGSGRRSLDDSDGPRGTSEGPIMRVQNLQQKTSVIIQEIRCIYG